MPFHEAQPDDPNMLVGVVLPADATATLDMAYVLAEEFVRLGFTKPKLMRIFTNPFYQAAYKATCELGIEKIEKVVDECISIWGSKPQQFRSDTNKNLEHQKIK